LGTELEKKALFKEVVEKGDQTAQSLTKNLKKEASKEGKKRLGGIIVDLKLRKKIKPGPKKVESHGGEKGTQSSF